MHCILLDNDDVKKLLPVEDCVDLLERAHADLDAGTTVCPPRVNLATALVPNREFVLKSWQCVHPTLGVAAVRLCSQVIRLFNFSGGRLVGRPEPAGADEKRYVGLIFLFDISDGSMLGVIHDAALSAMATAASVGLAVRYLARNDAHVLAMLGAGRQAKLQIVSISAVRRLSEVRVFYPLQEQREQFSHEMSAALGLKINPVPTVADAVKDSDIVATASSSPFAVFSAGLIQTGMHVTVTRPSEAPRDVFDLAHVLVTSGGEVPITFPESGAGELWRQREHFQPSDRQRVTTLGSIINGRSPGRADVDQITMFGALAGYSPSLFYAILGGELMNRARRSNVGKPFLPELFLQGEPS